MAINVNAAANQAVQLNNEASQLRNAKKQLLSYKSAVSNNWAGREIIYIQTAIDQAITDIDTAIGELDSLSRDVKNTAEQIKREEEAAAAAAAAARARAEKARRIQEAQNAYDGACRERDELLKSKEALDEKFKKASFFEKFRLVDDVQELERKIGEAEQKCRNAYDALRAAKA